jgi:hypothetical protein
MTRAHNRKKEYRIYSKEPGGSHFTFRAFTGSSGSDRERLVKVMEREAARPGGEGWEFRIGWRWVTTITTEWTIEQ